jgi:hypothetical protein
MVVVMTLHEFAVALVFGVMSLACVPTTPEQPTAPDQRTASPLPGLPERMGSAEVMVGIKNLKPSMLACGQQAGVETMAIKFWIEGNTGAVQTAELVSPPDASLAACVTHAVNEAGPAVFPRFATERQGFTFKFHLP